MPAGEARLPQVALIDNRQVAANRTADYDQWRQRALQAIRAYEDRGPGPEVAAETLLGIVSSKAPRRRYLIGSQAKSVARLMQHPYFVRDSPGLLDPLSQIIILLQPRAVFSKRISGAGRWGVRYSASDQPSFCAVLEGSCRLAVDGHRALTLEAGDFLLLPSMPGFTMSGFETVKPVRIDPKLAPAASGEVRHGRRGGRPDVRLLGGTFVFDSPDSAMLISLLPSLIHVRGVARLSTLVRLVGDEAIARRAARDLVLASLAEILLVEALRAMPARDAPPGLLRGLADPRLAPAIRQMHRQPSKPWTVAQLARTVALSRSGFFERFTRTVGMAPMEYLVTWRMAVAKDLLRRGHLSIAEVAERVGYGAATAFSTAFSRYEGVAPSSYAARMRTAY